MIHTITHSSIKGFVFHIAHKEIWCFHPVVVSYCADIPEAKDMASVLSGTKTNNTFHRCHVKRQDLASPRNAPTRLQSKTRKGLTRTKN